MKITFIGGGPGGYEAAIYAAKKGAEVVVIEKDKLGGTCLNRGCIPTKAFLASSEVLETVKNAAEFGINVGEPTADYTAILERKNKVVDQLVRGIGYLFEANGITHIEGFGKLIDEHTIEVAKADGTTETVTSDYIILATGSKALCPAMFNVDRKRVITSDEILSLPEAPKSLILVGGGVIGCEIGQFLNAMGTEVTIVEALPRVMATMDEDVSKAIAKQFRKEKIKVITGDGIAEVTPAEDSVSVKLASGKELTADYCLVAIGRAAYTDGLGVENTSVVKDERGRIVVDEYLKTAADNIYAIGDIILSPQLAHVASKEGFVAVDNIFGENKKMDYRAVPGCVFTTPQLASVGTLETQLQREEKEYKTGTFEFRALGKAQASGHINGFVKVITDMDDTVIGAEIVGHDASDMLQVLTLAVQLGLKAEQLEECIYPHPTMCEAIKEAVHDIKGMAINKA